MERLIQFLKRGISKLQHSMQLLAITFLLLGIQQIAWGQKKEQFGGKVVDTKGQAIANTSISVMGQSGGVISDSLGQFSIQAAKGDTLLFSHIGYGDLKLVAASQSLFEVTLMESQTNTLNDVVVVGYGTSTKKNLIGSVSVVEGSDIVKSPQPDISNSLAGRFSGLIASNRSGEPGYDGSSINIRGLATTGNNDVLVVIDGVPGAIGGFSRLNPNDIASVTVLKDASAAVYGSRAANGVILVTTKQGVSGKPMISYSYNQGFSSPTRLPKMADAATYAAILNEIDYYNNPDGGLNQHYTDEEIQKFKDGSDPINYPNTDWQEATLKNFALQNHQALSVRGGSDKVKYYLSLGTVNQNSLYKDGATKYKQYNFRSNVGAQVTKDLKVNLSLSGRQEDRNYPIASAGDIFRSIYRAYPIVIDRYPNGLPSTGIENNNPVVMVTDASGWTRNPTSTFNGILSATYDIPFIKGMSVDGFYSVDKSFNFTKTFNQPYALYTYNADEDTYDKTIAGGSAGAARLDEGQVNTNLITENIKLNYKNNWGAHHLDAFVGYEQSENSSETFGASRINYPTILTPELSEGGAASTDKDNYGSSYDFTRKSIISRVAYNYMEKYLLEGQMRIDGSSNFPEGHQYGYFPSVSAGWRISEEPWFKNSVSWINDLKLRASYGSLGNDNVAQFQYYNNYSFNNTYVIGDGTVHPGIDLTKLANESITWEVAKKMDIGLNAIIANNFNLELIYFQQKRSDILATRNASIPSVSGIVNPYSGDPLVPDENIGKVNNEGFEATLGYTHSGAFHFNISANMTYAKSKVVFIDEAAGTLDYQSQTGHPLNSYLLYKSIGIYRTQEELDKYPHVSGAGLGDLIYEDYNGDGAITADDEVRTKYGNIPQIVYGLVFSSGYKQFDFSFVIAGQAEVSQYVLPESGQVGNFYSSWADNRWSPNNPNGTYPRVDTRASSAISGGLYNSTFWLNDASFTRLKNVEFGYTFPGTLLKKIRMSQVRVYASASNLFTMTKVKDYDPEGSSGSGQFYPQQRIINLGVNVNF
ncbi:TonB-linked outer membrane protein, SusC/RagA family [Arachidicoccus rhizosphaerae]|uniref:TonB-linked outer membrane protein, SusC/RagA family n=1 Tax=Arachidicoccus rhizosphaerae TaxID=551991 RepID=A0A1H3Y6T5_9BACT|nr:TonB-dependent receptor [Arachidicoccus rhizosphaerae]SEA07335.1 TonB-linked outer membrane protein, SusC/RagA family [Arachidicoccus rhizosphaerae]